MGDLKDSLREISVQVDRCKEIVHKLLNLAREMEPVIQGADINDLIENMAALVEREAGSKEIRVLKRLEPKLPIVYSDPPLLRQVVLNLLINATHAVEKSGTITVTTKIYPKRLSGYWGYGHGKRHSRRESEQDLYAVLFNKATRQGDRLGPCHLPWHN